MKNKLLFLISIAICGGAASQTLSDRQAMNARATGYAIIAAKNPGIHFSVIVIPWDKANTLEYNATTQINSGWHPQAAIKGNYFDQPFDGTDFTSYSSVIVSQEEFDQYKNTGTQWWIVCSDIPSFSTTITSAGGNIGIGTASPQYKLDVAGTVRSSENSNEGGAIVLTNGLKTSPGSSYNWALYNMTGGYGNSLQFWNYSKDLTSYGAKLILSDTGNMSLPAGKLEAKEIKVTLTPTADFVFDPAYKVPTIHETEQYISEHRHLPGIPSAGEMEKNGVDVGSFQIKLLQKVEELTLYTIGQEKKIDLLIQENKSLKESILKNGGYISKNGKTSQVNKREIKK